MSFITKQQNQGVIALVLLSAIFAFMGVFGRYLSTDFELFQQIYLRVGMASIVSLLIFYKYINLRNFFKISKKELGLLFFRGSLNYIGVALFTYAAIITTLANVSVTTLIPSMTILSLLFLGEKINLQKLFLIGISIIGMFFIGKESVDFSIGRGEFFALLGDIIFGISFLTRRYHSDLLSNKELAFGMLFSGTITLFLLSFLFGEGTISFKSINSIGTYIVIFIAAIANVVIMVLANFGFANVKGFLADRILSLEIMFALIFGFVIYRELPHFGEWVGIILIVSSVLYLQKIESKN